MLVRRTKTEIISDFEYRLFPRKFIKLREVDAFDKLLKMSFDKYLNIKVYTPRIRMESIVNSAIELDRIVFEDDNGIVVNKVEMVVPSTYNGIQDFLNIWLRTNFIGPSVEFFGNIYRFNDTFKQFLFSRELYNQMKRMFFNKAIDYTVVGRKIIFGRSYKDVDKVMIIFLPRFLYNKDSWYMSDKEYMYLIDVMYGTLLYYESIALSELKATGVDNNSDVLLQESKFIIEEANKGFIESKPYLVGRKA